MGKRQTYPVRAAIRNGEVVLIRKCATCREDKVCTLGDDSEFPRLARRASVGDQKWRPDCKWCYNAYKRAERGSWAPEKRAQLARAKYERELADEERHQRRLANQRARQRAYRKDPEKGKLLREQQREAKRKRRAKDPEAFARQARERQRHYRAANREKYNRRRRELYADQRAREGKPYTPRYPAEIPVLYFPAPPFGDWLRIYGVMFNFSCAEAVATDLGIEPRRARAVVSGDQPNVEAGIVDKALQNARGEVTLGDRTIYDITDLYGPDALKGRGYPKPAVIAA